jgi:hypothetical protein
MRRFQLDAAILFADLPQLAAALGQTLEYREGDGPVLSPPIRSSNDIQQHLSLSRLHEELAPIYETVRCCPRAFPQKSLSSATLVHHGRWPLIWSKAGEVGQSYVRLTGVRFDREDEGSPVGHVEAYVDGTYGGIRDRMWNLTSSVAETIEQMYGIAIARIEQEIGVELLTAEQADMLGVARDTPALTIRRWYSAGNGRIFEVAFSRYPMGRFAYRNVLMRQSRNL